MAIERSLTKEAIGIGTGLNTSRPFRTEMPDPGSAIAQGAAQLAGTMKEIGREGMKDDAEKAARDAANSTLLEKDPTTGNYTIPKTPDGFGSYGAKIFDQMVEEKTVNAVQFDLQNDLNRIYTENYNDPEKASALARASIAGRLQGMDPRVAGRVQAPMIREDQERSRSALYRRAGVEDRTQTEELKGQIRRLDFDYLEAASAGDDVRKAEIAERIKASTDVLVAKGEMGALGVEQQGEYLRSQEAGGNMLYVLKQKLADGTLTEDDFDGLQRAARGQLAPGENVLGFTPEWIAENFKDERSRTSLNTKLGQMEANLRQSIGKQRAEQTFAAIENDINAGFKRLPYGMNPAQASAHILQFAARNGMMTQTGELAPGSMQFLYDRYGQLPQEMVQKMFSNMIGRNEDEVLGRVALYNELKNIRTQDRSGLAPQNHLIGNGSGSELANEAFMELVEQFGGNKEAVELARKSIRDVGVTGEQRMKKLREMMGVETNEKAQSKIANKIQNGNWFADEKWENVPTEARSLMVDTAAALIATGVNEDVAVKRAADRFTQLYQKNDGNLMVGGGWVRKDQALPEFKKVDERGAGDIEPLKKGISWLVDPEGKRFQKTNSLGVTTPGQGSDPADVGAVPRPDIQLKWGETTVMENGKAVKKPSLVPPDAELGKNLILKPTTERGQLAQDTGPDGQPVMRRGQTYELWYKSPEGGMWPLRNVATDQKVLIDPHKMANHHNAFVARERQHLAAGHREFFQQFGGKVPEQFEGSGSLEQATPRQVREGIPIKVDHLLADPARPTSGERGMKPAGAAGAGGTVLKGGRDDGIQKREPIQYPPGFEPAADRPARGAGEVSAKFGDRTAVATEYFIGRGYTPAQAAGIVGNLIAESALKTTAHGDFQIPGGSHGIAQWNRARLHGPNGLMKFAADHKMDPRNFGTQLAFIEHELDTDEHTVKRLLKQAKTVDEATAAFVSYERPEGHSWRRPEGSKHYDRRLGHAKSIFNLIGAS